mgnify:CR=1 FL=1
MNAAKSRSFPAWRRRVTRCTITSTWYADRSRARTERIAITQKANNRSHKREGPCCPRSDLEFQSHLQRLELERRGENKARAHKLNFQDRAIAAHLAKLGATLREHAA